MINLCFEARGQTLERKDKIRLVAFARNQHYAEFKTDGAWSDKAPITAQFIKSGKAYDVPLTDGKCLIPWEVLAERGKLEVCLIGGDLLTTNTVAISVLASGVVGGLVPTVSSPTVYSHIMDMTNEIENRVNEIAKGDFHDKDVIADKLYFKKNDEDEYAVIDLGEKTGIRVLNNLDKNSDWFIKLGSGDGKEEVENGIQFESTGEFIVKNVNGDIIRLTQRGGAKNVIKGNETLTIESGDGFISFDSTSAGIAYTKANWNDYFKQLNINADKGVNIQAKNNSYFQSGDKKLVIGNDFNSVEFRTDGVAKFKDVVNVKDLQIGGTPVMNKVADAIKVAENNISQWYTIKNLVTLGLGAQLFPVGTIFKCSHSEYGEILWKVAHHNLDEKSMTLISNVVDNERFSSTEALYYCQNALSAGTYSFKLMENFRINEGGGKTYNFTLNKAVPAGGVFVFQWGYGTQAINTKVSSYTNSLSRIPIETVSVVEGSAGVFLGTADGTSENMNHSHRISYGSGNWKYSAVRQWLNTDKNIWKPQTHFDLPPSWANTKNGFMCGIDEDFLNVVKSVEKTTITNDIYECDGITNSFYKTDDKFWLPSKTEIFGTVEGSGNIAQDTQFDCFVNTDSSAKIMSDKEGTASVCWLRSPMPQEAYRTRTVNQNGVESIDNAVMPHGIVVCCTIK